MADNIVAQFEMREEDLLGYSVGDVSCISCRPLCTNKIMRRYNGGPLFMCTRKEPVKEILAAEFERAHPGQGGPESFDAQAAAPGSAPGGAPAPGAVPPPGSVAPPGVSG